MVFWGGGLQLFCGGKRFLGFVWFGACNCATVVYTSSIGIHPTYLEGVNIMEKAIFTIEGGMYVEGIHDPRNRWNGWATPIFPIESVQVIATFLDDNLADFREGGIVVVVDGVPHWKELDDSDGEVMLYPILPQVVDGVEHFEVGAGGWVWDDVEFPAFDEEDEGHAYWVGEVRDCQYKSAGVMATITGGK